MTYLLGSDIIAELASSNPDPSVILWLDSQSENSMYISVVNVAEISELIEKETSDSTKSHLKNWLNNDLLVRFSDRINEVNVPVSIKWGEIISQNSSAKPVITVADSLLMAIALEYDHTIVTRDTSCFAGNGVKTLNPFTRE